MPTVRFSLEEIVRKDKFSPEDMAEITMRRRDNNRLGYAYQLTFARLVHRFPEQQPLEVVDELLDYVGIQLNIPPEAIEMYQQRQQTLAEHRSAILNYLGLRRFGEFETKMPENFLFDELLTAGENRLTPCYTVLVCFLWQVYRDTIDHMIDTHHKLMMRIYNHAQEDLDRQTRKQRRMIRRSLSTLHLLGRVILDETIQDGPLRRKFFSNFLILLLYLCSWSSLALFPPYGQHSSQSGSQGEKQFALPGRVDLPFN